MDGDATAREAALNTASALGRGDRHLRHPPIWTLPGLAPQTASNTVVTYGSIVRCDQGPPVRTMQAGGLTVAVC